MPEIATAEPSAYTRTTALFIQLMALNSYIILGIPEYQRLARDNVVDVFERFTIVFEHGIIALREVTKAALEWRYWTRSLP